MGVWARGGSIAGHAVALIILGEWRGAGLGRSPFRTLSFAMQVRALRRLRLRICAAAAGPNQSIISI